MFKTLLADAEKATAIQKTIVERDINRFVESKPVRELVKHVFRQYKFVPIYEIQEHKKNPLSPAVLL